MTEIEEKIERIASELESERAKNEANRQI